MAKFKFENLKFEQIMKDYATIREQTIPDAVHANARLLCVEFARRTQPFGDDKGKRDGNAAIARDLLGGKKRAGIFAPISPAIEEGFRFSKSSDNVRLFVKKNGEVYGTEKRLFRPDASASTLRSFHKQNFINGKMSSAGSRTRNIGRWKFVDKMFVTPSTLNDYVASVQKKVGIAKSGWAACAKQLRRVVSGSMTRGIPGWVTRHLGDYNLGNVEDRTKNKNFPTVVLTNTCKYADAVLPMSQAIEGMNIVSNKMKKQMEMILKKRKTNLQEAS